MITFLESEKETTLYGKPAVEWIEINSMNGSLVTISVGVSNLENEVIASTSFNIEGKMNYDLEELILSGNEPSWIHEPQTGYYDERTKEHTSRWIDFTQEGSDIVVSITENLVDEPKEEGYVLSYAVDRGEFKKVVQQMRELHESIEAEDTAIKASADV